MAKKVIFQRQIQTPKFQRIFGIGINKTGTTSLKRCFDILGLHPIAPCLGSSHELKAVAQRLFVKGEYEPALQFAKDYRSFEDRPWNYWEMYRYLDRRFPDSHFILTVRDPQSWWRCVERWIIYMKPWLAKRYRVHLRANNLNKDDMIKGYLRYNRDVIDYFQKKENFLIMDFEKGDGWVPLCTFLDCSIPQEPFPHVNRLTYDRRDLYKKGKILIKREKRKIAAFKKRIIGAFRP